MVDKIQQDTVGLRLNMVTGADLTDTTDMILVLAKSAKVRKEIPLTASNISNPATGEVFYITQVGDLPEPGDWFGQIIDVTAGRFIPSEVWEFTVEKNI